MGTITTSGGGGTMSLQGKVHGGQQGVSGSSIQLYTVGTGGNGTAATPMLTEAVTTDSGGNFSITKAYTCGENSSGSPITSSNQVYLVATGGNPGTANNPALTMVAALGPCSNLSATTTVFVNELTTVAAAWALAPFATSAGNIAASGSNSTGITNAFLDAGLLVDTTTGTVATLPSNLTIETGKLNALADAIASCVNSDGTTACTPLFTAATVGTSTPTDTFTAALNIVQHPGQNVAEVYSAIGTYVPFPTTLTAAPNDWTMSLTVTGGGLDSPTTLGIDSQNNIWVANQDGPLSAFNPQGTPLSPTGFGGGNGATIAQVYGLAIDPADNVWVTNYNGYDGGTNNNTGSVTKFYGAKSGSIGTSATYSDGSIGFPFAIAANPNGNIYIANSSSASATIYNDSGTLLYPAVGATDNLSLTPNQIALDASQGFWLSGNDTAVAHISFTGALLSDSIGFSAAYGMATDSAGNLWVADQLGGPDGDGAFDEITTDTSGVATIAITGDQYGGINHPQLVAVDAAQNVWFTNKLLGSITEIAGIAGPTPVGTSLSPDAGGFGRDASLGQPFSLAPDRAGNLWVSNFAANTISMFFGLAAPTKTPLQPVPTAP
jgi:hypothetical protein